MEQELTEKFKSLEDGQRKVESLLLSQKLILSFKELIDYTGRSRSTLYKLSMNGKIPGANKPTGGKLYFDRRKIDTWLLSNHNSPDQ